MDARARRLIELLGLRPHPEGGFFRETFRSVHALTPAPGAERCASTAIYFLLPAGAFSTFHRIRGGDEIWHHHEGESVEIHMIAPDGAYRLEVLGPEIEGGERPQVVVPAETWQAAVPRDSTFALCGCTVTPGFEFADLEMPTRDELLERFPQHADVIRRFARVGTSPGGTNP